MRILEKLNKKYSYSYSVCSNCDTPVISRNLTPKELEKYQSQFKDKGSVSKFDQDFKYIVVDCDCGNPFNRELTVPTTIKRIKEVISEAKK